MGVASLVTVLWNWLYLKNEQMKWNDILHAGAISHCKVISIFGSVWTEMGMGNQIMEPWNLLYLKGEFANWVALLHTDCEAIIFGQIYIVLYIFDF